MQFQKIISIFLFNLFIFSFFINAETTENLIEDNLNNSELSAKVEEVASEMFEHSLNFNEEFDELDDEEKNELDSNLNVLGKMAELFPEDLKKEVLSVWENTNILFAKLDNPLYTLFEVYKVLLPYFNQIFKNEDDPKILRIKNLLNEIEELFLEEKFIIYLQTGLFKELMQPRLINIIDSLKIIVDDLNDDSFISFIENKINTAISIENDFEPLGIEKIKTDFIFLYNFLDEFINPEKDISKFVALINSYLHKDIIKVQKLLDNINKKLDDFILALDEKESFEIIKAAKLWKEQFAHLNFFQKGEKANILRNIVKKIFVGIQKCSPVLLGGFYIIRKVLELHFLDIKNATGDKAKCENSAWKFILADHSIRLLMLPLFLIKRLSDLKKKSPIAFFDSIDLLDPEETLKAIMLEFMAFYLDSDFLFRNQIWPLRTFYRTGSVWLYYNFIKNSGSDFKWWDSKNEGMRRATWFSVKDGYNVLAKLLESISYKKIKSKKLKAIKNNTLGLVKPELIGFTINTAAPLLARKYFNKTGIADLTDKDIFSKKYFGEGFFDFHYVGHKPMRKTSDGKEHKFIGNEAFIENRILGYLAFNMGAFLGRKFASKNRGPIKSLIAKTTNGIYKGFAKIGLVDNINIDFANEIRKELKENIEVLWKDPDDPLLIMARQLLFSFFVKFNIMTQHEIDEFKQEIVNNQLDEIAVTEFIEKIVTFITDKIVIKLGTGVGAIGSWFFTRLAEKKYGPFYPKIKKLFA